MTAQKIAFAKGHGTENDFIIIDDPNAELALSAQQVAALCDRRAGIGADGVLRVVRAGALVAAGELAELAPGIADDDWFMDYRNADGSVAQMCGNGVRVFAHWLRENGHISSDHITVGTRAGARGVTISELKDNTATVTVEMGPVTVTGLSTVRLPSGVFAGLGIDVGNPHLAAIMPGWDEQRLADLALEAPEYDPEFFPEGLNFEVATPLAAGEIHMRVFERGVGETRSCGTGTVAAATAALADAGQSSGQVTVHIPGGSVEVNIQPDGTTLTGPSVIVARGTAVLPASEELPAT